jgi:hypothetical protein
MKKKSLNQFKKFELTNTQMGTQTGGAVNIFCELYIGRQERKGEPVNQGILNVLMQWDQGLSQFFSMLS